MMWKNPVVAAIAGLLVGFFAGYVVGEGRAPASPPAAAEADPHSGVPGAPPLTGAPGAPSMGAAATDPRLMERARELERLLATEPGNYALLVQAGNVQYDMGSYAKAAGHYEKARAVKDDSADVLTDLGVCYRELTQPRRALEMFERAAALAPEHWQSRYNAAVVKLFDLDDAAGAKADLDKLKELAAARPDLPGLTTGLEQEISKRLQ